MSAPAPASIATLLQSEAQKLDALSTSVDTPHKAELMGMAARLRGYATALQTPGQAQPTR